MNRKSLFLPFILFCEIFLIFLILYFNIGMFGFDGYIHLQYVESIISNNKILEINIAQSYYDFIGFHVFASALSLITGISSQTIYKYVSVIIPILIFDLTVIAFIRHVEKKKKGYLPHNLNIQYLAVVLLYPSIIGIQMLLGRPNSLGISLFSLCLYLYLCKPEKFRAQIIAGFLALVTLKVHHLSAVFLLPVIFFSSILLAVDYKSILSLVYAIPAVIIVETILNSREFNIVNDYFTQNEVYANLYNLFIRNEFIFLILWVLITLIGFLIRRRYGKRIARFFTKRKILKVSIVSLIIAMFIVELIGLFSYTTNLPSWFISVELTILFILSAFALLPSNKVKNSLFLLGFLFYGFTALFSLIFSSQEYELSWVAPRTFIFTIIFVGILAFLSVSNLIAHLKRKWLPLLMTLLVLNSYFSFAYMSNEYLPGYNLTNDYQNLTLAENMELYINFNYSLSAPFSISKFLSGVDIYSLPLLINSTAPPSQNVARLTSPFVNIRYIIISRTMDQWLGLPFTLSENEIMFYLAALNTYVPTFNLIMSNGKNFLLYRLY